MFEPIGQAEMATIGISAANKWPCELDEFMLLECISEQLISDSHLDLLLVAEASPIEVGFITQICDDVGCIAAFIESSSHEQDVVWDVMLDLKGKLDAHEMPDNLDIADIRELSRYSEQLLAFDCAAKFFHFLETSSSQFTGCIYLANGTVNLDDYTQMNQRITGYLPPSAYFASSIFSVAKSELTVLLGVENYQQA
ncbi:hypothetical protein [Moritella marina]|uniref:hypothetical protein n=1 Tax=Moritella marina TaxID=90736 RepID=UPI003704AA86